MTVVIGSIHALMVTVALVTGAEVPLPQEGSGSTPIPRGNGSVSEEPDLTLVVDLAKIQKALSRPPAITTKSDRPVFRVEIFAPRPTIEMILGPDYLKGPVPYGGMTHNEFLNMVTPVEYRGYSMFTNGEGIAIAATSIALQWALMKAVDKFKEARDARAQEAARREVIEAMNELEAARKKAGLPAR